MPKTWDTCGLVTKCRSRPTGWAAKKPSSGSYRASADEGFAVELAVPV
jgi:hypothetical protein